MNDELDKLLDDALSKPGAWDAQRAASVKSEVSKMYADKLKMWANIIWGLLAIDAAIIAAAVWMFAWSDSVKVLVGCVGVALFSFESTILMRLWYWQINTKYAVLQEVAELRLQVAELAEAQKGQEKGSSE